MLNSFRQLFAASSELARKEEEPQAASTRNKASAFVAKLPAAAEPQPEPKQRAKVLRGWPAPPALAVAPNAARLTCFLCHRRLQRIEWTRGSSLRTTGRQTGEAAQQPGVSSAGSAMSALSALNKSLSTPMMLRLQVFHQGGHWQGQLWRSVLSYRQLHRRKGGHQED